MPKREIMTPGEPVVDVGIDPKAATRAVEKPQFPEAPAGLRASDIDPAKIKRAVLTQDGWVCPSRAPMPAGME